MVYVNWDRVNGIMVDFNDRLFWVSLGIRVVLKMLCIIIIVFMIYLFGKRSMLLFIYCIVYIDVMDLGLEMLVFIDILM